MKTLNVGTNAYTDAFVALEIPPYVECKFGDWELFSHQDNKPAVKGYFNGAQLWSGKNWVLKKGGTVWMSVTPMELESQGHHALAAQGNVLIGGMGMGAILWNVAKKNNVKKITVLEREEDVIELAEKLFTLPGWEHVAEKTTVVNADALQWVGEGYDVAIFDIWPSIGDQRLRPDLQKMAANIKAKEYAAWTMEMDFITWCMEQHIQCSDIQKEDWRRYSDGIGVPLILRDFPYMASLAVAAAINTTL